VVPPPPETAPCAGEPLTSQLNAGVDCLEQNCSTADGRTTSAECAEANCLTEVLALILAEPPQRGPRGTRSAPKRFLVSHSYDPHRATPPGFGVARCAS
jgi:hypothetical protein